VVINRVHGHEGDEQICMMRDGLQIHGSLDAIAIGQPKQEIYNYNGFEKTMTSAMMVCRTMALLTPLQSEQPKQEI
jgi:hypothetical protein